MKYFLLNPVLQSNSIIGDEPIKEKLEKLGDNTGNMVFANAIKEQVQFEQEGWIKENMVFRDEYIYILPCSNFLAGSNRWIEPLVDVIENQPARIVLVGLGAQARLSDKPIDVINRLSKKQKRFFSVLSERSTSIGVRGEFTAACLETMGIKNSQVIGCPSAFKYMNGKFPEFKKLTSEKVMMTVTPSNRMCSSKVLKMGIQVGAEWIMQSADEIIDLYHKNFLIQQIQKTARFPGVTLREIKEYQRNKGTIFWNFRQWNSQLEKERYTFAFGTRFHGNMMALRNGIPTIWIAHDTRTEELIRTLDLPGISVRENDFTKIRCIENLIERCDYTDFIQKYPKKIKYYKDFLKNNGVIV